MALPVGGPPDGAVTSTLMPGMSAVSARIEFMITLAGRRFFQSTNSNWIWPITSSVTSLEVLRPAAAGARVDRRQLRHVENLRLDLPHQPVLLRQRKVAARVHKDDALVGLDVGEEFDALADLAVEHRHADQERERQQDRDARMVDREPHGPDVPAVARGRVVVDLVPACRPARRVSA